MDMAEYILVKVYTAKRPTQVFSIVWIESFGATETEVLHAYYTVRTLSCVDAVYQQIKPVRLQ